MNVERFEDEFPDFYVDYGFKMNPTPSPAYPELLAEEKYDVIIEKAMAENMPDYCYCFIKLTWKTLLVGTFPCTTQEYDQETIPQQVIDAAQSYNPPSFI